MARLYNCGDTLHKLLRYEFAMKIAGIRPSSRLLVPLFFLGCVLLFALLPVPPVRSQAGEQEPRQEVKLAGQSQQDADAKSAGCVSCHTPIDSQSMHTPGTVFLGCIDCHGGKADLVLPSGTAPGSPAYEETKHKAHVAPLWKQNARSSANSVRSYTEWLRESPDYVQFVNPGDLRIAHRTCGTAGCHEPEVRNVRTSMMAHGAMLWGAALYNNGSFPLKNPHFGESYSVDGLPQKLQTWPPPTPEETRAKGVLPFLQPIERWEVSQPGNVLRVFERGGGGRAELGNPLAEEEPGRPDAKLSSRGFGTLLRTDPTFLGLQKTRLLDPLLYFPGTNDHPGDYRGSGCTGCHVVYANDRNPAHSDFYAEFGNLGHTATADPTIPKNESGHPIRHLLTKSIPSSQCMVCHMHPGTNMVTSFRSNIAKPTSATQKVRLPKAYGQTRSSSRKSGAPSSIASSRTHSSPIFTAMDGCFAPSSSRTAKATCLTKTERPSLLTTRRSSRERCS